MSEKIGIAMCRIPDSTNITYYIFEENGIYTVECLEGIAWSRLMNQFGDTFHVKNVKYETPRQFRLAIKDKVAERIEDYGIPFKLIEDRKMYFNMKFLRVLLDMGSGTLDEIIDGICERIKSDMMAVYVTFEDGVIVTHNTPDNPYVDIDKFFVGNDIFYRDLIDDVGFSVEMTLLYRQSVDKKEAIQFVQANRKDLYGYIYTLIYRHFLKRKSHTDPELIRFLKIDSITVSGNMHSLHIYLGPKRNIKQYGA